MDPVSIAMIGAGMAGAAGAKALTSSTSTTAAPAAPAVPDLPGPQQTPGAKPKAKSSQPSFLGAASLLPQGASASGGPQGKTLLGQ